MFSSDRIRDVVGVNAVPVKFNHCFICEGDLVGLRDWGWVDIMLCYAFSKFDILKFVSPRICFPFRFGTVSEMK